jgi:hypothetical protein
MDQIIYYTYYSLCIHRLALVRLLSTSQLGEVLSRITSYDDYKSTIFYIRNILPGTMQPGRGSKMCVKLRPTHTTHISSLPTTYWYNIYNGILAYKTCKESLDTFCVLQTSLLPAAVATTQKLDYKVSQKN